MNHEHFPVHRSILDGQALVERILRQYDLPQPISCRLYSTYANDIYQVYAGTGRYWLRVYTHGEFSHAEVEAEVAILKALADSQTPAVRLLATREGTFVHTLHAPEGVRYALLTAHAAGSAPGRTITLEQATQYGQAVAQIHESLDQLPQPYHRPPLDLSTLLDEPLTILQPVLATRSVDWHFLGQVAEALRAVLTQFPRTPPAYGLCHGDLHKVNVLIDPGVALTGLPRLWLARL